MELENVVYLGDEHYLKCAIETLPEDTIREVGEGGFCCDVLYFVEGEKDEVIGISYSRVVGSEIEVNVPENCRGKLCKGKLYFSLGKYDYRVGV